MLKIYYGHIQLVRDPLVFDKWFEKMNSERQEKVLRCKKEFDKRRSLLAGILLNYGLENNRFAKQVFYSISHSGNYVICVLSDRRVGIDIENKFRSVFAESKEDKLDRIAQKCLTMGEEIHFKSCETYEKAEMLINFWTKKESYSKALGKGLAMDFSKIDTEEMEGLFWSGWLEEGYFCSLYVENGIFNDLKIQEIVTL